MNSEIWPWNGQKTLRFDRFMNLALHDPERGYYTRRIRGVGKTGDFTTTPMISESLGKAIASWAVAAMRESKTRNLIELGPGEGYLAATVIKHLPWWRRPTLHLVETSEPLRKKQKALLGKRVHWHDSIESALEACKGNACIYSNEFADAFPVRIFRKNHDDWSELHLAPEEIWKKCASLPDSSIFELNFSNGQRVEVSEAYHDWLKGWLPIWKSGRVLTIDYGAPATELYHRRPRGSVRAYLLQQRIEGPQVADYPGRQDITADVNFTDIQRWSAPQLRTIRLIPQREFLLPYARISDAWVTHQDGAGDAFRVLDQVR